jgi:peptidoglycan/LPS O-acetylase OafA/YrhL
VFDPNANALGSLRLVFAVLVLVSHTFPLGGFNHGTEPSWAWTKGQQDIGGFAVAGFFVLSGFLVTRSFVSSSTSVRYLWKRVLRIFPGYWACLVATVVLFGPLAFLHEHGTLHGYLDGYPDSPLRYLTGNAWLWIHQYPIDNLLGKNPLPHAFDGSLWTLIYEFKCYLAVMVLGIFGILQRGKWIVLCMAAFLWFSNIEAFYHPAWIKSVIPAFSDVELPFLTSMFALGVVIYLFRDRIVISRAWALVAAITFFVSLRFGWFNVVGEPAFAYLCFWVAVRPRLPKLDRYGDFSYGMYVYAYLVQQMATMYGVNRWGFVPYLLICFAASMLCAVASWFLVERTFLRLKALRLPTLWRAPAWWANKIQGKPAATAPRRVPAQVAPATKSVPAGD